MRTFCLTIVMLVCVSCAKENTPGQGSPANTSPPATNSQPQAADFSTQDFSPDIKQAIFDFQNKQGAKFQNDYAVPKKLIPLIKKGMTPAQITAILGPPGEKKIVGQQVNWFYGLFYSQFINIRFDSDGKVVYVQSTVMEE